MIDMFPHITMISTHTPLTGRDIYLCIVWCLNLISTHTPLTGRDVCRFQFWHFCINFYSHAPYGKKHTEINIWKKGEEYLLTRPFRDVTSGNFYFKNGAGISTHTPLTGRDFAAFCSDDSSLISTHTPLTGRDKAAGASAAEERNFYSHAPYGTWLSFSSSSVYSSPSISTHTPLTGRDNFLFHKYSSLSPFLLTRPLRDVTLLDFLWHTERHISTHTPLTGRDGNHFQLWTKNQWISTHTPLTGRDTVGGLSFCCCRNFYSHAPYGTWHRSAAVLLQKIRFLLTRPLRDVTRFVWI